VTLPSKKRLIPLKAEDQIDSGRHTLIKEMAIAAVHAEQTGDDATHQECISKANSLFSKWERGYFCALRDRYGMGFE
jgi:hypothetical protein